jgi:hypothetical protein
MPSTPSMAPPATLLGLPAVPEEPELVRVVNAKKYSIFLSHIDSGLDPACPRVTEFIRELTDFDSYCHSQSSEIIPPDPPFDRIILMSILSLFNSLYTTSTAPSTPSFLNSTCPHTKPNCWYCCCRWRCATRVDSSGGRRLLHFTTVDNQYHSC